MALVVSRGNMYEWVTHEHSHLRGQCPHQCEYCYVKSYRNQAPWQGPVRLAENELTVNYGLPWTDANGAHSAGDPKTIFIEHSSDLFAEGVPDEFVSRILAHAMEWPRNIYLYQTKNPGRLIYWLPLIQTRAIFGTTIETNRLIPGSKAPTPAERYVAMKALRGEVDECSLYGQSGPHDQLMVTIEPVMAFDVDILAKWLIDIKPDFVNIGADSKGHGLPEPTWTDILNLVAALSKGGVKVNHKSNLARLQRKEAGA